MKWFDDVSVFCAKFRGRPPREVADARRKMVAEEAAELVAEIGGDRAKIAHEAVDLIYVALGALVEAGLTSTEVEAVWSEIHRANMEKAVEPGHWKARKPAGWTPPDVQGALARTPRTPRTVLLAPEQMPLFRKGPVWEEPPEVDAYRLAHRAKVQARRACVEAEVRRDRVTSAANEQVQEARARLREAGDEEGLSVAAALNALRAQGLETEEIAAAMLRARERAG